MNRTIRYRLHPQTQAKAKLLHGAAGACRYVWNHFVSKLQDEYQYSGRVGFRFFTLGKQFTLLRKYNITWLQDYSMANVRLALKPLETNYQSFFSGQECWSNSLIGRDFCNAAEYGQIRSTQAQVQQDDEQAG